MFKLIIGPQKLKNILCSDPLFMAGKENERCCEECADKIDLENLLKESENVHSAVDFKGWDHGKLSDLFWYHLGEYVKDRNPELHFPKMKSALYWAFHDSHGLSSSFCHALKWAKIDIQEVIRWTC